MRTLLRLILGTALSVVVVVLVVMLNALAFPTAPFLMGDREEAGSALTSIAIRSVCCLAALSAILTIFLKRFRPG
jgi:hypothetical protein